MSKAKENLERDIFCVKNIYISFLAKTDARKVIERQATRS